MTIKKTIKAVLPNSLHLPLLYNYLRIIGQLDDAISLIKTHLSNFDRAIDIGANIGTYTYALSRYFFHVDAFEPNIECTKMLRAYANRKKNIKVYNVGLSNVNRDSFLYIPKFDDKNMLNAGLGSLNDPGGICVKRQIEIHRLDDYNFNNVGFIKVDVEGHEMEVLHGATKTIHKYRPVIFIEIEQRHLKGVTIEQVIDLILSLGYEGRFYQDGNFHYIKYFSYEKHQLPYLTDPYSPDYVNNFLFKPVNN